MRVVVALGGNALLRRDEPLEESVQRHNVARAVEAVSSLARGHELVLTHGNGPQVGLLALEAEAYREVQPYGLDVLGAESQGMVGYLLEGAFRNALPDRDVVTLLTQVVVDASDPAFAVPTKPIGPRYSEDEVRTLEAAHGWRFVEESQGHFRRVVASPEPKRIVEAAAIRILVNAGVLVVCAGGGGVPIVAMSTGAYYGVEAVVDKDLTAALLARDLEADVLLLLTDVAAVETDWGTPRARRIRHASAGALRALPFAPGSMGPKVEAACRFVETGGQFAAIGALEDATRLLEARAGTRVVNGPERLEWWSEPA